MLSHIVPPSQALKEQVATAVTLKKQEEVEESQEEEVSLKGPGQTIPQQVQVGSFELWSI